MNAGAANARANRLWADLVVEELVRNGVSFFCVAPGSRSTPLVAAISENPKAETFVHFDERGTSFAALGYARATGRPAAWVTTSGTAVANGFPAVVEASTDGVPMILLTADRPPELRKTGANQTIEQPGIFGGYVRWSFDVPAPALSVDAASVLTTVDQAVHRANRPPSGPVHMNMMFREPLLPDEDGKPELPPHLEHWREGDAPYTRYSPAKLSVDEAEVEGIWSELRGVRRGLVVAGRLSSRGDGEAAARLAESLGWPFLPDIGSQARIGVGGPESSVPNYDILLANEALASNAPEAVLHIGGGAVSKRLSQYIARHRPRTHIVVKESPARLDPSHIATHSVESDVAAFCDALSNLAANDGRGEARREASEKADRRIEKTSANDASATGVSAKDISANDISANEGFESAWVSMWRGASEEAALRVEEAASKAEEVSEPFVARAVSRLIPDGHGLVVASSMPIRDMDSYAVSGRGYVPVAANRGASGIDGTVATAAGYARGSGRPATLVIGDLALLHDLNSLAMVRSLPITIVAVNNDGGGIFSFLPVSKNEAFFEEYFGTPQNLGFRHAASMFGLGYENPKDMRGFEEAYRGAVAGGLPTLIEIFTDRGENVALHREMLEDG